MQREILAVLVVGFVFCAVTAGLTTAKTDEYVGGSPDLNVYVPDAELEPGTSTQLTVQIENSGSVSSGAPSQRDLVTTARAVSVEVVEDGPFAVSTGQQSIGSVPDGSVREAQFTIHVPETVEPGEYTLDLRLRYSYTSLYAPWSNVIQEESRSERISVDVIVEDGARFALQTVGSDVQVGGSGTVTLAVQNVGGETARNITLTLNSTSPDVLLGETRQNTVRIERLTSGENTPVTFDASVREDVSARPVTLTGRASFKDSDGVSDSSTGLSASIRPIPEQEFSLSCQESTLRVGEPGILSGTITNDGPSPAEHVVLSLADGPFVPRSGSYAIGNLSPGETDLFQFRGTVPAKQDAVPGYVVLKTEYRTPDDNDKVTSLPMEVTVAERRDSVNVTPLTSTFTAGETGTLELAVTNHMDDPIQDVRLQLLVEDPLESDFRSTVISRLSEGETDRVAFDLEVDSDAPASSFPATIDINYTDDVGHAVSARSSTLAINVTAPATRLPVAGIAVTLFVLVMVVAGGWWFYGGRFGRQ